ncbi:HD domain-containing protein [Streptomyces sp. XH2]|uniref:HD domain-containing protein n=1 Tax=Streptomyces sp. XH2 TaxID=3412483 RepID=UPI003C7BC7F5
MEVTVWAHDLAKSLLAESLPRRWAHSCGVRKRARSLAPILGADSALLEAAAVLHDVSYSPKLVKTGFHPLDGARFLRDVEHADERILCLVAHHSYALLEAEERGLREALAAEFDVEEAHLVDALVFCDMTTTPDGGRTDPDDRIAEIVSRYGPDSVVGRFIRRAEPEIQAACERVNRRLRQAGSPGV